MFKQGKINDNLRSAQQILFCIAGVIFVVSGFVAFDIKNEWLDKIPSYSLTSSAYGSPFPVWTIGGLPLLLLLIGVFLTKKSEIADGIAQGLITFTFVYSTLNVFRSFDAIAAESNWKHGLTQLPFYLVLMTIAILSLIRSPFEKVKVFSKDKVLELICFVLSTIAIIFVIFSTALYEYGGDDSLYKTADMFLTAQGVETFGLLIAIAVTGAFCFFGAIRRVAALLALNLIALSYSWFGYVSLHIDSSYPKDWRLFVSFFFAAAGTVLIFLIARKYVSLIGSFNADAAPKKVDATSASEKAAGDADESKNAGLTSDKKLIIACVVSSVVVLIVAGLILLIVNLTSSDNKVNLKEKAEETISTDSDYGSIDIYGDKKYVTIDYTCEYDTECDSSVYEDVGSFVDSIGCDEDDAQDVENLYDEDDTFTLECGPYTVEVDGYTESGDYSYDDEYDDDYYDDDYDYYSDTMYLTVNVTETDSDS